MLARTSRPRNFFRKLVVNGVNNSKTATQNDCLMRLYDADAELKAISNELDSFDGKKDPIRCNLLVSLLRTAQDKVISLLFQLMDDCCCERASRDYRMKFPDEILLSEGSESLNGQIWFGAECLSAGSNILNHTKESTMLRPMAKTLTQHLDSLRNDLRDLVIDGHGAGRINQTLIKKMVDFDNIFARFEYEYVRTMLPIRTIAEIEKLQEVAVLFSETLIDCVKRKLIKQEDIDEFQPIVMIAVPRLAIVRGLLYRHENPIYTRHKSQMCSIFQPFHGPLHSIRKLLRGLSPQELFTLERMLANDQSSSDGPAKCCEKTIAGDSNNETNADQRTGVNDISNSYDCDASTSNNSTLTNVLMDGLQYPIGQKRSLDDSNNDCCIPVVGSQQGCVVNYADVHPSSSKASEEPCNSASSPSTSISSDTGIIKDPIENERKTSNDLKAQEPALHQNACDNDNCCLSPPESDAQLEKLIANFNANISSDPPSSMAGADDGSSVALHKTDDRSQDPQEPAAPEEKSEQTNIEAIKCEEEAMLEEIFQKQAQQLLHRLFVAISGVADQLQSNFASDLRFILRHIFSSEMDDDEDESEIDDEDELNQEDIQANQSDSSLPIEQGIEAQEVTNLIDLESGYSPPRNTYSTRQDLDNSEILATTVHNEAQANRYWSVYEPSTTDRRDSGRWANPVTGIPDSNSEIIADIRRVREEPSEVSYHSISSPNDPSIMDDEERRQRLMQQHLQSLSRQTSARSQRHVINAVGENAHQSSQHERRSRHSSHSRSRRRRGPPIWVPDQLVVQCSCCNVPFTLFRRRHHCRACGQIFCSECSKYTKNLNCWGYNGPVRVCESCYHQP